MGDFQENAERPAVITRTYVVGLLSRVFGTFCPDDLVPSWLDYLVAKGVVARDGEGYALPGSDALGAFPADAQLALHRAIEAHARSSECPKPLHYVIPVISSGGAGSVSQSGRYSSTARHSSESRTQPDLTPLIERLSWDRPQHLKELTGFGSNASAMFDWVIRSLRERAAAAAKAALDRARQQEEEARQADQLWKELRTITDPVAHSEPETLARWERLAEWGSQRLAHVHPDGRRFINFSEPATSVPRMAWAGTMKAATDTVVLLVRRVGRDLDLGALRLLAYRLRAALNGNEIEIDTLLPSIYSVVNEAKVRLARSTNTPTGADPWEDHVRELLERGSIEEAMQLAAEVWRDEERRIKWGWLMEEVAARRRKEYAAIDTLDDSEQHASTSVGEFERASMLPNSAQDHSAPSAASKAPVPLAASQPATVVGSGSDGSQPGSWVPVSVCISKEVPQLKDHTAVRRFCEAHRIPTREPRKQRREVHWDSFQKVKKELEGSLEKLEATADTLKSLREHEQRTGSKFPTG